MTIGLGLEFLFPFDAFRRLSSSHERPGVSPRQFLRLVLLPVVG